MNNDTGPLRLGKIFIHFSQLLDTPMLPHSLQMPGDGAPILYR